MNTKFLSTVAAIALLGGAAFAQSDATDADGKILLPGAEAEAGADATATPDAEVTEDAAPLATEGETESDVAEDAAPLATEGETESDVAEDAAPMTTEGETDTDVAGDTGSEEDRTGLYGSFADARVTDLIGMNVLASSGDDIGEVDDLIHEGDAVLAVVGVGGFLGLGEHKVALPLADFTMGEDALQLGDMTKEQLEAMPEYAGEAESLPLDTTVSGEPIAQDELLVDPAANGATVPSDG